MKDYQNGFAGGDYQGGGYSGGDGENIGWSSDYL